MHITLNATVNSFLLADLILYLFLTAIDLFITEAVANKMCKIVLVIICLIIAFFASLFIKIG